MNGLIALYFLLFLCCILTIWHVFLLIKYRKLKDTFRKYKKSLRSIAKTINSVRYGNLFERVDSLSHSVLPNFSDSIDRMIESIVDREDMINEYQADLSKQIETQKEIVKLKEDFVATLTHDLKVPIIAENNMLNFLLENRFGELNEKQKEAVCHLKNSNKELIELVEILLETYKLNETNIELTRENVDLNRLIEKIILEMQPIADSADVRIQYKTSCEDSVFVDEFYLKRVLKNIILNAISFSNSHSSIDIDFVKDEKNFLLKIKNYGKIIKEEDIEHIFDKYFSTSKKFRKVGTGLGLYLSNKIIKAHNGTLKAQCNEKENTTTMVISLPCELQQQQNML